MMHIFKTLLHWLRWIITQKMLSLFSNSHFSGAFFVEEKLSHFTHHFLSHQWMGNESHSLLGNALTLTLFSHSRTLKTWFTLFFVGHTQGMMILAFLEDSSREGLFRPIGYGMQLRAWLKQVFSLLILDYIQLSDLEDRSNWTRRWIVRMIVCRSGRLRMKSHCARDVHLGGGIWELCRTSAETGCQLEYHHVRLNPHWTRVVHLGNWLNLHCWMLLPGLGTWIVST